MQLFSFSTYRCTNTHTHGVCATTTTCVLLQLPRPFRARVAWYSTQSCISEVFSYLKIGAILSPLPHLITHTVFVCVGVTHRDWICLFFPLWRGRTFLKEKKYIYIYKTEEPHTLSLALGMRGNDLDGSAWIGRFGRSLEGYEKFTVMMIHKEGQCRFEKHWEMNQNVSSIRRFIDNNSFTLNIVCLALWNARFNNA